MINWYSQVINWHTWAIVKCESFIFQFLWQHGLGQNIGNFTSFGHLYWNFHSWKSAQVCLERWWITSYIPGSKSLKKLTPRMKGCKLRYTYLCIWAFSIHHEVHASIVNIPCLAEFIWRNMKNVSTLSNISQYWCDTCSSNPFYNRQCPIYLTQTGPLLISWRRKETRHQLLRY